MMTCECRACLRWHLLSLWNLQSSELQACAKCSSRGSGLSFICHLRCSCVYVGGPNSVYNVCLSLRQTVILASTQGHVFARLLRLRELYYEVELPRPCFDVASADHNHTVTGGYVRVDLGGLPPALQTLKARETAQACCAAAQPRVLDTVSLRYSLSSYTIDAKADSRLPAGSPIPKWLVVLTLPQDCS